MIIQNLNILNNSYDAKIYDLLRNRTQIIIATHNCVDDTKHLRKVPPNVCPPVLYITKLM